MALVERERRAVAVREDSPRHDEPVYENVRMDLRLRYPLRWVAVAVCFVAGLIAVLAEDVIVGTYYTGTADILVLKMEDPHGPLGVQIIDPRIQSITGLAQSEPFLVELARRSGVDRSLDDLRDMVSATRPKLGARVSITVRDHDPEVTRAVARQLVVSLGVVVDQARAGALQVLDENGRDQFADQPADYRGPLYLDLYGGRPAYDTESPSTPIMLLGGAGLGMLLLIAVCFIAHERERVSHASGIDGVVGMRQLGRCPRFGLRRSESSRNHVSGMTLAIEASCPDGLRSLAFAGSGIRSERAAITVAFAASVSTVVPERVTLIDLDLDHGALSRRCGLLSRLPGRTRAGVTDCIGSDVAPEQLVRRLRSRSIPRSVRAVRAQSGPGVYVLGVGTRMGSDVATAAELADIVERIAQDSVVILALPPVPGRHAVRELMARCDLTVLVMLDGWSPVRAMVDASRVLNEAAPGRCGYLLLENG